MKNNKTPLKRFRVTKSQKKMFEEEFDRMLENPDSTRRFDAIIEINIPSNCLNKMTVKSPKTDTPYEFCLGSAFDEVIFYDPLVKKYFSIKLHSGASPMKQYRNIISAYEEHRAPDS